MPLASKMRSRSAQAGVPFRAASRFAAHARPSETAAAKASRVQPASRLKAPRRAARQDRSVPRPASKGTTRSLRDGRKASTRDSAAEARTTTRAISFRGARRTEPIARAPAAFEKDALLRAGAGDSRVDGGGDATAEEGHLERAARERAAARHGLGDEARVGAVSEAEDSCGPPRVVLELGEDDVADGRDAGLPRLVAVRARPVALGDGLELRHAALQVPPPPAVRVAFDQVVLVRTGATTHTHDVAEVLILLHAPLATHAFGSGDIGSCAGGGPRRDIEGSRADVE